MDVIIHPGMPKTGSSSIQQTLVGLQPEGWAYPASGTGNMGRELMLMFEDAPWTATAFTQQGLNREEIEARRDKVAGELTAALTAAAAAGQNTVFSAERIFNVPEPVVTRLRDYYVGLGFTPRVVAYVRRPVSFMQSAFQQNLKTDNPGLFHPGNLYPHYRRGFATLDRVFGRENVTLKLFDKDSLAGGDAVIDFYAEMGHDLPASQVIRVNETLSLPAVALLYAQRQLGGGMPRGFKRAGQANAAFIAALAKLEGPKPQFSHGLLDPILDRFAGDLEWLEKRVGVPVIDRPEVDGPDAIGGHDDLLALADAHADSLHALLQDELQREGPEPRDRLRRALEALRGIYS